MLLLHLEGREPVNKQIYLTLRKAILSGRLRAGERLAPSRLLAQELSVSRNTVLHAYEQLAAEGYAEARVGAGTFVVELPCLVAPSSERLKEGPPAHTFSLSSIGRRIAREGPQSALTWKAPSEGVRYDFRCGDPGYADLPLKTWARLLARRACALSAPRLSYQPLGGAPELREALAGYLARARGVVCDPEQLLITHGSQQAIDLCVRLFVDPGDTVVLEEPHYTGFTVCLSAAGATVVHVSSDEEGLCVDRLDKVDSAKMVFVTPAHQFPGGGVLPLSRRLMLIDWARRQEATIVEDDYDGEFRYEGCPIECLQSLDREKRVVYIGTASKVLFPAVRIGWLVAPVGLADVFRNAKGSTDRDTATLEQLAFADFIEQGHLERHVRRTRKRYAARRNALLESIDRELGDRAAVVGTGAGVHVLLRFPALPARAYPLLRNACREHHVGVYSAGPYYAKPPQYTELLLGYASMSEEAIRAGVVGLRRALEAVR